ncbi:hypothetical protein ONS95_008219 [Cadophora gregata]|uniref:uncharacterized protein n=1 Tax=Cadophora gregata TaxID=51156 RepID=UPI0026DAEE24|nr:uncharacterized protein ONS95_008219 [Cadophora gregata]KAK0126633.1 hypothetical protein ONS95_008219 [Cadophora gregata]
MVAGCTTSNNLHNVYILSLSYVPTAKISSSPSPVQLNGNISSTFSNIASTHSSLTVRVSYLGICISQVDSQWMCSSNARTLSSLIKLYGGVRSGEQDPLNLIWIAGKFKDEVLFSGLLLTAIPLGFLTILLLATFPGWHEEVDDEGSEREVKPFPSRPVIKLALGALILGALFCFISVMLQHVAGAAGSALVESLSYGTVRAKVGTTSMVIGWGGELLYVLATIGLLMLALSISNLMRAVDD